MGRLLAQTRGLPMLVREYVEGLRSGAGQPGAAGQSAERWWPPASVRELLRRRLQAASEPTQQMLSTAAVLGSGCDADLLRAVSGRGEAETVEALDEAVRRFLITEVPPAGEHGQPSYEFPYEALREVVYESATLARRRLLHGRAADTLARRYERDPVATRAAAVAEHLQRAGRDAEAAVWWWRAAARARELYAHAEEYAHLRQAEALGYPAVNVAVALGDAATMLGRYREALAEFEAAAAAGGDAPGSVAADIEHKLAEVHHRLGDWALAEAHLAAAAQLLDPADTSRRARIEADRAVLGYRRGATADAARLAARALAAARAAADPAAVAQALNVLGMLAARRGDPVTAAAQLRESLAQARQLPDRGAAVAALNNLARLLAENGHPAEALPWPQEALALGRELGDQHRVAALHTNLADLLHAAGQRDAALVHLKEAAGGSPRWTPAAHPGPRSGRSSSGSGPGNGSAPGPGRPGRPGPARPATAGGCAQAADSASPVAPRSGSGPWPGSPSGRATRQHRRVVPDQRVTDRGPAAGQHPLPGRPALPGPGPRIGGQPGRRPGQRGRVARRHQVPGDAVLDQVDRAAHGRRDHRQPAGRGLLDGLAERLMAAAVHEDVEAGEDPGQLLAAVLAEEDRGRQPCAAGPRRGRRPR